MAAEPSFGYENKRLVALSGGARPIAPTQRLPLNLTGVRAEPGLTIAYSPSYHTQSYSEGRREYDYAWSGILDDRRDTTGISSESTHAEL